MKSNKIFCCELLNSLLFYFLPIGRIHLTMVFMGSAVAFQNSQFGTNYY